MNTKEPIYLSINEFSKLTGVPKERLRFYDEENIIKPAKKDAENGYRYYLPQQLYPMFMIIILVRFNYYTLDEIRNFINDPEARYSDVLKFQLPILQEKYEHAEKSLTYIHNSLAYNEHFEQYENDIPYIVDYVYPPRYVTPISPAAPPLSYEAIHMFSKHVKQTINDIDITIIPFAMIMNSSNFYDGKYDISGYYTLKLTLSYDELYPTCSPQKSILYKFNGPVANIKDTLDKLHSYMAENDMVISDTENVHISVLPANLNRTSNTECAIRIIIPISQATGLNPAADFTPRNENPFLEKSNYIKYSSGEFARLCNISKETLRFYIRNKLLKPCEIDEKGYKYFCNEQLGHFYFIKMLQKSGCTIKEIKTLLIDENTTRTKILKICLNRQKKILIKTEHYYKMTKALLDIRASFPKEAASHQIFEADLYFIPHQYIYSGSKMSIYSKESVINMAKLIKKYYEPEKLVFFPLALNIAPEDFLNGSFMLYGHSMFDYTQYNKVTELPIQKYVCVHQEIPYSEIPEKLKEVQSYVIKNNYRVCGDIRIIMTFESFKKTMEYIFLIYIYVPIEDAALPLNYCSSK